MLFFCLLGGGLFFLFMAFFLFLPVIILSPSKFALAFTIGCCLILSAFAALKGWRRQVAQMFARDRLLFTSSYLGSIVLTVYASIIMKSYLLSLVASGLQVGEQARVALEGHVIRMHACGSNVRTSACV